MKRYLFLGLILVLGLVLNIVSVSAAENYYEKVNDISSMDEWKNFFGKDVLSNENAGGVWTDKTVFTENLAVTDHLSGENVVLSPNANRQSFLIAMSAIASNQSITGQSNVPTDTMLVLDVSGSMNNNAGNNDVAAELVEAANESLQALFETNKYNRVGIVLYSGPESVGGSASDADSVLILPLGRYSTGVDGNYLTYRTSSGDEFISVDSDVVIEGTQTKPAVITKEVSGATYIQKGVIQAMEQFVALANNTIVTDPVLGNIPRMPVMVLMSDGAPTVGSTNFTDPETINLGRGNSTSAALGFVTQLSAAYAKEQIMKKYNSDCLFYTLGLGVSGDVVATNVLNPSTSLAAIDEFWTSYNALRVGGTVRVQGGGGQQTRSVTKIDANLEKTYVDQYFSVDDTTTDLAAGLKQAFADIVGNIQLQSTYYPTLVSEDEDLSGYVSFVDKIGQYMEVTDIKGLLINNQLYSGLELSRNFVAGGGNLGTYDSPTELGDEMVHAVQQRLDIKDLDTARTLIGLAYENGQIRYVDDNNFSNYIGWYANAAGEFLGFYHQGLTELPVKTGDVDKDPVFIIKSYGYLGAVDATQGVSASDMMYATVQVREDIDTGEQTVAFAVPAALIPVVTYDITLNENNELVDLSVSGAEYPIRLIYEVALKEEINEFTIHDKVDPDYIANNTNDNGSVDFYTNQYEKDNSVGYGTVNAYSYFNPSKQNSRYYYTEDATIYADTNGTLYVGDVAPDENGVYYRSYIVYKKVNNELVTETMYRQLSVAALRSAKQKNDNSREWYIASGNVHVNLTGYTIYKGGIAETDYDPQDPNDTAQNKTNTLIYSNVPFVDTQYHDVDDSGYYFYIGATLGNNGRISLLSTTGIRLQKIVTGTNSNEAFIFTINNLTNTSDNDTYDALLVDAYGVQTAMSVTFTNGSATVSLRNGDVLYIGGLLEGDKYSITETETEGFIIESVSVSGQVSANVANFTIEENQLVNVVYTNAVRGVGNLTIAKEIEHDFSVDYEVPTDKEFTVVVTLSGIGVTNKEFTINYGGGNISTIRTDENGSFQLTIKHGQQFEIINLPEGIVAHVVEINPGTGFEPIYWENGVRENTDSFAQVTILSGVTASVIVVNDYTAARVYPVNINVDGNKTLEGREWQEGDSFTFELQKWNEETSTWTKLASATVGYDDADKEFSFADAFAAEEYLIPGIYIYRVVEIEPTTGAIAGIIYDKNIHSFGVVVEDVDMNGQLIITEVRPYSDSVLITSSDNTWSVEVDFINNYLPTSTSVYIDINKSVTNESNSSLALLNGFRFGLYQGESVVYESSPTTDSGFARLILNFDQGDVGAYNYVLKEIVPENVPLAWKYSTQEINVTIVVTYVDGVGLTAVIYQGDTEPAEAASFITTSFTNIYDPTDTELTIDFVSKEISGRALRDREFTFEIQDLNGNAILMGSNLENGSVVFDGKLTYNKVGVYFYNIVETSADTNGVTTDKTTHELFVTITDNNGALQATYSILSVPGNEVIFRNVYQPAPEDYIIRASKVLTGRTLLNDEFTFVMSEAVDADGTILADGRKWQAKNFADGSIVFSTLTFTEEGTYYYVVSEVIGNTNTGIVYDENKFVITITVSDNENGSLIISEKVDGLTDKNIEFTNEYIPVETTAQIIGQKILNGKNLVDNQFTFELLKSNANWEEFDDNVIEEVKNLANGTLSFSKITYEKGGSYYYLVREVSGGKVIDGITYDDIVYRIRVDVIDDLLGHLSSRVVIMDDYGVPQTDMVFTNEYNVVDGGIVTLEGEKTLHGREMVNDEFTFDLYLTDGNFELNEDSTALQSATNMNGKFSFELEYDATELGNTYYYLVKERNSNQFINGVKYSDATYYIIVELTDKGDGSIDPVVTISNGDDSVDSLDFINEYNYLGTVITLSGEKVLHGRELANGEFVFELYETEKNFVNEKVLTTIKNSEDGTFEFANIELDEAKTYYFVIKENSSAKAERITYDNSVYQVVVDVKDDYEGNLYVNDVEVLRLANNNISLTSDIVFENYYDEPDIPNNPNTGDSEIWLWYTLLVVSSLGIGLIVLNNKRFGE